MRKCFENVLMNFRDISCTFKTLSKLTEKSEKLRSRAYSCGDAAAIIHYDIDAWLARNCIEWRKVGGRDVLPQESPPVPRG